MKKAAGAAVSVLKGILFTGFSLQIIFGIVWMCLNVAHPQRFAGNWGSLYRGISGLAGKQVWLLYTAQLTAAYYAAHRFLGRFCRRGGIRDVWRCLAFLTFPTAMQCHLAVSPHSFVSSLFLLELAAVLPEGRMPDGKAEREVGEDSGGEIGEALEGSGKEPASEEGKKFYSHEKKKTVRQMGNGLAARLAQAGAYWLFLALLESEYVILGAVPLVLALLAGLRRLWKQPRSLCGCLLLFLAFGGMITGICTLTEGQDYLPDRESAAFGLFHRAAWPTLWQDHEGWPEEVRQETDEYVWAASFHANDPEEYIRPVMLEKFGEEQAVRYYLKMAVISWKKHSFWTVRQVGWDVLGYGVTLLILPWQLSGVGYASYSGRNYEMMLMHTPRLTKYYMDYGCRWFAMMFFAAALLWAAMTLQNPERLKGRKPVRPLYCLLWAGAITAVYTMRGAGVMDYKYTVGVNLLWLAAALVLQDRGTADGETEKIKVLEK
ncbi:MAG: hypothetical protein NC541_06285 [bacterium]|nr:hypothetical protein [bacterium]